MKNSRNYVTGLIRQDFYFYNLYVLCRELKTKIYSRESWNVADLIGKYVLDIGVEMSRPVDKLTSSR